MRHRTYYHVLGISPSEGSSAIRNAFRDLARRYHPDLAGAQSTPFFQEIVEAYEVLSDPRRRMSYDRGLADADEAEPPTRPPVATPAAGFQRPAPEPLVPEPLVPRRLSLMRDFVARQPTVDEVFDRIHRNFTDAWRPKSRRLDALDLHIDLSVEEALRGGVVAFDVPVFYPCPACHGTGRQWLYSCGPCGETGMVETAQTVELRLPPGVGDGTTYHLPLRGLGIHNLYLRIHLRVGP